jgi:hypothetical protein
MASNNCIEYDMYLIIAINAQNWAFAAQMGRLDQLRRLGGNETRPVLTLRSFLFQFILERCTR